MRRITFGAMLLFSAAAVAEPEAPSAAALLPTSAYRLPMEEVIAIGQAPYWQQQPRANWDAPKAELPLEAQPSRLQWAPRYVRDERDDYNGVREQLNPQPKTKLFELHF